MSSLDQRKQGKSARERRGAGKPWIVTSAVIGLLAAFVALANPASDGSFGALLLIFAAALFLAVGVTTRVLARRGHPK